MGKMRSQEVPLVHAAVRCDWLVPSQGQACFAVWKEGAKEKVG